MAAAEAALERLEDLFLEADLDGSGALDRQELASVMHQFYRTEKVSRSRRSVQEEVDEALSKWGSKNGPDHTDQSGRHSSFVFFHFRIFPIWDIFHFFREISTCGMAPGSQNAFI